jgi:hypothetical protein
MANVERGSEPFRASQEFELRAVDELGRDGRCSWLQLVSQLMQRALYSAHAWDGNAYQLSKRERLRKRQQANVVSGRKKAGNGHRCAHGPLLRRSGERRYEQKKRCQIANHPLECNVR